MQTDPGHEIKLFTVKAGNIEKLLVSDILKVCEHLEHLTNLIFDLTIQGIIGKGIDR